MKHIMSNISCLGISWCVCLITVCMMRFAIPCIAAESPHKNGLGANAIPVLEASFADGTERVTSGNIRGLSTAYIPSSNESDSGKPAEKTAKQVGYLVASSFGQGPEFTAPNIMDGRSGTVSVWFRPENWDNLSKQGYNSRAAQVELIRIETSTAGSSRALPPLISVSAIPEQLRDRPQAIRLDRETWRHLVVAWVPDLNAGIYRTSKIDIRIYLDGKRLDRHVHFYGNTIQASHDDPGTESQVTRLVVGQSKPRKPTTVTDSDPFHSKLKPPSSDLKRTALRDVQLYERALTDVEVANLYQIQTSKSEPTQPLPDVDVQCTLNPALQRIDLQSQLLVDVKAKTMSWRLMLDDDKNGQRQIATSAELAVMRGWAGDQQDKLPIEWGKRHKLFLEWHDRQGKTVFEHTTDITCPPAPVWLNSSVSEHPGEALPGFDPVKVDAAGEVVLWNRRIRFASSGMPEHIQAAGKSLLAKPVQLMLKTTSGLVKLTPEGEARVLSSDDEQATVQGILIGSGWRVTTQSRTEFDGMIKFTMRVEPPHGGNAQISALSMVIPARAETSELYSLATGRGFGFRGGNAYEILPQADGTFFTSHDHAYLKEKKLQGSFIPYFMFTDGERGLAWFCESDKGWTVDDKTSSVTARRSGDQAVLELNMIRKPTALNQPIEYVFGMHVLPIRPMADDHRAFRSSLETSAVDSFMPPSFRTEVHRADKNALWPHGGWDAAIKRLAERDKKISDYYQRTQRTFEGSLFYLSRPWPGLPPESLLYQPKWYLPGFIQHTPQYTDCFIYWMRQWLERTAIRGVYIDDIWPPPMTDPLEGPAYYLPDGSIQAGYDFFNQRELLKRLRWAFHDTGRRPVIWIHNTQTLYPNLLGFAEAFYDGEMDGIDKGDRFEQRWPIHRLKFDRGQLWGSSPVFMNKYKTDSKLARYQDMRSFIGEMFLQDIGFSYALPYLREHSSMFTWCTDALSYIAYDDPHPLVTSKNESVYVSAYIQGPRSDPSQVYLVVVNRSDKPVNAVVDMDKTLLPVSGKQLLDIDTWTDDQLGNAAAKQVEPVFNANALRLDIRPWDFRLIQWVRH